MAISAPLGPKAWKFKEGPWTPVNYHARAASKDVNLLPHSEEQVAELRWMGTHGSFYSSFLYQRLASSEIIAVRIWLEEPSI